MTFRKLPLFRTLRLMYWIVNMSRMRTWGLYTIKAISVMTCFYRAAVAHPYSCLAVILSNLIMIIHIESRYQ